MPPTPQQDAWIERILAVRPASRDAATDPHPAAQETDAAHALEAKIAARAGDADVVAAASTLLEAAGKAEPALTEAVGSLASACGGRMIGLPFRRKSPDSLRRKIATDVIELGLAPEDAARDICDAVRYTACFEPDRYAAGVTEMLASLRRHGFTIRRLKNAWAQEIAYKGINVQVQDPNGQLFELQFHTPASFKAKDEDAHPIYERMRLLEPSSPAWAALDARQMEIFAQVPRPPGAETIKEV
jgi:hypothetical protein